MSIVDFIAVVSFGLTCFSIGYILVSDYSMIVATRPDPTVRPPSRYFNPVLSHIFYGFLSKIQ